MGAFLATSIVAGNMIGSGIYLLPAALASVGAGSLLGWLLAAFGAAVLAAVYSLLALRRPSSETIVDYPAKVFHPVIGFFNWAAYWAACWVGNIAVLLVAVGYLTTLFGVDVGRSGETALLIAAIWLGAAINFIGPRIVGRLSAATLLLGLAPIAMVIAVAAVKFDPELLAASWNVSGKPLLEATPPIVLTIFWAFLGLESANAIAGAVKNPQRTVPIAAVAGTLIAATIYALASTALFGLIPATALSASSAPFADAVSTSAGALAGAFVAAAAFARTFGCSASWLLVSVEAHHAGANTGYLPRLLSGADRDNRTRDIMVVAVMMTVVSLATISPTLNEQFLLIVDITVLMFLFVYGVSSLALMRFSLWPDGRSLKGVVLGAAGVAVSLAVTVGYFTL